jgi:hypothetical protein
MTDTGGAKDDWGQLGVRSTQKAGADSRPQASEKNRFMVSHRKGLFGLERCRPDTRLSRPDPAGSIKTDLAQMTEAWRKYKSTRVRDGVYILLDQAYKIALRWKRERCAKKNSRLMLKLQDDPIDMKPEPFAVLLYCAGVVDPKDRSKFSRVLRVAEAHKATSVRGFAKKHGGINKVAEMFCD